MSLSEVYCHLAKLNASAFGQFFECCTTSQNIDRLQVQERRGKGGKWGGVCMGGGRGGGLSVNVQDLSYLTTEGCISFISKKNPFMFPRSQNSYSVPLWGSSERNGRFIFHVLPDPFLLSSEAHM